jgi:hypothetical protein
MKIGRMKKNEVITSCYPSLTLSKGTTGKITKEYELWDTPMVNLKTNFEGKVLEFYVPARSVEIIEIPD